jgi:ABC-2 type transport system permease protein
MHAMLSMIVANLKMTFRNRGALFWNLLFPAIFIVIFGAIFGNEMSVVIDVATTGPESAYQQRVMTVFDNVEAFDLAGSHDQTKLMSDLEDGDLDAVVVFGEAQAGGLPPVTVYYNQANGPTSQVVVSAVQQVLISTAQAESPVTIALEPVTSDEVSFIDFFVPGIIAMSLMNSGVIGLSTAFVTYRERGILRRMRMTPFPLPNFILARIVSQVVIAFTQAVILIVLAKLLYGLEVKGNIGVIALALLIGSLTFLAIGFAISSVARTTESAAGISNLITFPMLFLSGVFFDVDSAPGWLQPITKVLPLHYLVEALREPMTLGNGLDAIWVDLLVLVAIFTVAVLFAVRFFRWDSRAT